VACCLGEGRTAGPSAALRSARDDKGKAVTFIGSRLIGRTEKKLQVPASLRCAPTAGPGRYVWSPALRAWMNYQASRAASVVDSCFFSSAASEAYWESAIKFLSSLGSRS
jgi:hypothetical protein